jgi:carbon storage regulator
VAVEQILSRRAQERNVVMLVLSRKKNESIVINNDITIVVVEIRGDKVRLGVEAPKEVPVHRREVYDAIKRNAAVQNGPATTEAGSSAPVQS